MDEKVLGYTSKILDSFDYLRKLLAERAKCSEDEIVIYDDPLQVIIRRDRIDFYVDDEYRGSVSKNFVRLEDDVLEEAKMWLQGLAMLKFKRFSVRR